MSFIIPPIEKNTSNPILASIFAKQELPPPPVSITVVDKERVLCKEPFTPTIATTTTLVPTYAPNSFYTTAASIQQNIATIQTIQTGISDKQSQLLQNYTDLSNNVQQNIGQRNYLSENNTKYHYTDQQDPNVIINPEESKDIHVAVKQDIDQMKYYQDAIFTAGLIAGATCLIAVITLSR
jgi:hypothetical protein